MDKVAFAHVTHVEVVECLDDLVLSAGDGMRREVEQGQDIAERDRPK